MKKTTANTIRMRQVEEIRAALMKIQLARGHRTTTIRLNSYIQFFDYFLRNDIPDTDFTDEPFASLEKPAYWWLH